MTALSPGNPGPDGEANQILSGLLERLDEVLDATAADAAGLPLFVVEGRLAGSLRTALPGVRFAPEDIREWASHISS
jgi:hypothetical protein